MTAVGAVIPPGEGRALTGGTTQPTVKVGPHTGSRLIGLLESDVPPGGGFPGHVHDEYEEAFYVLDGEIEYLIEDTWIPAAAGSTVFVPAGVTHGFRNTGDRPARHLAISSPSEAMTMIEELVAAPDDAIATFARYRSRPAPTSGRGSDDKPER
jgi:quercetin dioxygenase-like cupin family protein